MLVTALGCVAVLVAGFLFLVKPQHKKADDLRSQVGTIQDQTATLRTQLATLRYQQRTLPAEQKKLAAVVRKLPSSVELPTLTRQLAATAAATNIDLVTLAPGAVTAVTSNGSNASNGTSTKANATAAANAIALQATPLSMTVTGTYFDLERFLGKLENLSRAMLVDGFAISFQQGQTVPSPTVPGQGELTVTIQARVFQTSAPITTTLPTSTAGH